MERAATFIDYIEQSIIQNWDRDALTDYKGITLQYKDVARKIAKFHLVLESADIQPGDKIAVCGRNSAHWAVTFLATVTYGAVIVPILHEFKADNIHHIVNHSEAKLLFVGARAWEALDEAAMPLLEGIVVLEDFEPVVCRNEKLMEAFEHRNARYGARYPMRFRPEHICYRKEESPDELAVINYTSGTTGYSKGVMLPYRSLWSNVDYCREMRRVQPGDHIVSMLPLGHVFGMVYDFLYGFSAGAHLYFLTRMPSPKIIAQSFAEIRPKVISCVPLIVEKIIKKNILPRVDNTIGKLLLRIPIVNDKIKESARKEAMEIFGGQFDEIIINILKSVYILSSGIIFVQFSNIWLPLAQNVAVLFTTDYGINMRYTHGLVKNLHIFSLINSAGKHFLFPIAGISSILCQKEEIILVLTHLIHQGIILTATGRSKNYIPLFQLFHNLIKFSWQLAILVQQGSIHVRKNYFYHILHPVSPIAKRLATLQHLYSLPQPS